jgi:glycosyltransferase involved in cell wall biosynthesis
MVNIFLNKKSILSTHYIYNLGERPIFSKVLVWVFKGFDRMLLIGKESQVELEKAGLDPSKMTIFRHWIDNKKLFIYKKDKTEIRKKLGFPDDKFVVLFVGRLLPMKGISFLLEAAKINNDIEFVFIGDGEMKGEIIDKANRSNNVIYVGKKFKEELVDYYNASDAVALPSVEEGSSLVVIEALSCGKPVIVTSRGCSKDMFDDYLGEKIVPSAENILMAVEKIVERKRQDVLFEEKCREFALEHYSEKNAEEIVKNYYD